MRTVKGYLVALLSAAMVLATVATASAATVATGPFSDVTSTTNYATAINFLAQEGIVNGTSTGIFSPSAPVTRAEMAKIVVGLAGKTAVAQALMTTTPSFTDAAMIPTWAWGYVNAAEAMGVINGYPDGAFMPNANVTDAEALAMFTRVLGDNWDVTGVWPTNYVLAGYNLGIATGLSSVSANVPALRGEIAQMAYRTALDANYTVVNSSGTKSLSSGGLYTENFNNGVYPNAVSGTAGGVGASSLQVTYTPAGASATTTSTYGEDTTVMLVGGTTLDSSLDSASVTVVRDTNELVNWVDVSAATTTSAKTLNDGTQSAAPTGFAAPAYSATNASEYAANNACPNANGCNTNNGSGYIQVVQDNSGNNYLLMKDGTTLEYTSTTTISVNGTSEGTLMGHENTLLFPGASITATTSNGIVTAVSEVNWTDMNALVTAIDPANDYVTYLLGTSTPYVVDASSTTVMRNGQASSVSALQVNDVVNIELSGITTTNTASPSSSPNGAVAIDATNNTVSGTVTASSTTTTSSGTTTTVTLQPSSGSAVTITTDGNFPSADMGDLGVNSVVTLALDSSGEARTVLSTTSAGSPVVMLTGSGTASTSTGTSTTLTGISGGNTVTYTEAAAPGFSCTGANCTNSTTPAVNGNGYTQPNFWVLTLSSGDVTNATYLAPVSAGSDVLQVVSAASGSVTLEALNSSGAVDTGFVSDGFVGGYLTVINGTAFSGNTSEHYLGFTGLNVGDQVTLYAANTGGKWYYGVTDNYR